MEQVAGRVILLAGWRRALVAFLAGAFATLAQAPFDFPAAAFVAFPILLWLLEGASADARPTALGRLRPFFLTGWWFGFGYFVAGLWWIGNALLVEADSFAWALPLAVLALPAALALFYGLATAIARLLWTGDIGRLLALAVGFGVAEWLRSFVLTGFPWNAVGYAAMPVPLMMQSVSLVGVAGLNALAVFVFAAPALLGLPNRKGAARAGLALAAIVAALHVGYGAARLGVAAGQQQAEPALQIRIVQPSIAQSEKWDDEERERIFRTYLDLSRSPSPDGPRTLLIWPETALPYLLTERSEVLRALGNLLDDDQTLLLGAVRSDGTEDMEARYSNALVQVDANGEIVDAVDKVHLVPFGEYLPFAQTLADLGIEQLVAGPMNFVAGPAHRLMTVGATRILPLICYEAIFPGEIADAAREADVLVNVTNDAWYGLTPGPYQHMRQAQVRAAEFGRPLLRSGNNGVSAVVDPYGRIVDALDLDAVGVLDASVPLAKAAWTLPGSPERRGLVLLGALVLLAAGLRLLRWRIGP